MKLDFICSFLNVDVIGDIKRQFWKHFGEQFLGEQIQSSYIRKKGLLFA